MNSPLSSARRPSVIQYSHNEMKRDLLDIIRNMHLEGWQPDAVLGITRGGLIPSAYVSHYFDIPLIPINLSLRDFKRDFTIVLDEVDRSVQLESKTYKNLLVLDDIIDSGETFSKLREIFIMLERFHQYNFKYASLIFNETNQGNFTPQYYGTKIDKTIDDSWYEFDTDRWWKSFE